jgi:hypothetical protein
VPRDLYELMVEALRVRGALRVESPADGSLPSSLGDVLRGTPEPSQTIAREPEPTAPRPLHPNVVAACERYAFGSRDEVAANMRVAYTLRDAGRTNADIVAALRDGAELPAWAGAL